VTLEEERRKRAYLELKRLIPEADRLLSLDEAAAKKVAEEYRLLLKSQQLCPEEAMLQVVRGFLDANREKPEVLDRPAFGGQLFQEHPRGPIWCLEGHEHEVWAVCFGPDGLGLSGGWDKTVRLWNLREGRQQACLQEGLEHGVCRLACSSDGQLVACGCEDGTVHLWRLADLQKLHTRKAHQGRTTGLTFSPDGRFLASADYDEPALRLWSLPDMQELDCLTMATVELAVSPDGRSLLGGSLRDLWIWDLEDNRIRYLDGLRSSSGYFSEMVGLAISPDSQSVLLGGYDGTISLRDLESGAAIMTLEHLGVEEEPDWLTCVAYSPDGRWILSGGGLTIRLWDAATGTQVSLFEGHSGPVESLCFSADGALAWSGGRDRTVRLWKLHSAAVPLT
jgi:WD40 repeat protein